MHINIMVRATHFEILKIYSSFTIEPEPTTSQSDRRRRVRATRKRRV